MKSKKSALLLSFTSLLLCFAMLVGSTFAWFTDTATTGVNKIQAGNLDVKLMMLIKGSGWVPAEGETLTFKTKDNRTTDKILWEPGCTYELPALRIDNCGNLALKYKIIISGIKGDAKLNEAIEWKITYGLVTSGIFHKMEVASMEDASMEGVLYPGPMSPGYPNATSAFIISGHMKEDAGNEYQGLSIEGIGITVVATQATDENDSFGNQYDKDATYPETFTAVTAADYQTALEAVKTAVTDGGKNVTISVKNDISGATGIVTGKNNDVTVDLGNKKVEVLKTVGSSGTETLGAQFLQRSSVTLKNGTYKFAADSQNAKILIQNYSDLTLDSVTLDAGGKLYALSSNCGKVTIKGATNITASGGGITLDVMHWENDSYKEEGTSVTFDETMTGTVNGKIKVYCYGADGAERPVDDDGATLTIMGGTFKNSGLSLEEFKKFVPAGYNVTENADGSFTVSK